jgi:hypothetical protein
MNIRFDQACMSKKSTALFVMQALALPSKLRHQLGKSI